VVTCRVNGCASIVRVHCDRGAVNGEHPVILVCLVAEYETPAALRDDLGFITVTHMTATGYSEN